MKNIKPRITDELIQLVIEEATKIKEFATDKEKQNLSLYKLDPTSIFTCIYGLMTYNCFSRRAIELLNKCTKPFVYDLPHSPSETIEEDDEEIRRSYKKKFSDSRERDFSPIEFYILIKGADIISVIDFIKGKTDKLIL